MVPVAVSLLVLDMGFNRTGGNMSHGFQPGNYNGRLSSGPSGQIVVTVTRVTPTSVVIASLLGQPATRRRVHTCPRTGSQFFFPLGQFSMAPVINLNSLR